MLVSLCQRRAQGTPVSNIKTMRRSFPVIIMLNQTTLGIGLKRLFHQLILIVGGWDIDIGLLQISTYFTVNNSLKCTYRYWNSN